MVEPTQTLVVPVMVPADGELVTLAVVVVNTDPQPVPLVTVNVIVAEPVATPVSDPVEAFTLAIEALLVLQAPLPPLKVELVKDEEEPGHTEVVPEIVPATGSALTVNDVVVNTGLQPKLLVTVKVMVAEPALTP